jgi:hypothetical protein
MKKIWTVIVLLAAAMIPPSTRAFVLDMLAAAFYLIAGILRRLGINTPGWMANIASRAKTVAGVLGWIFVGLTLLLAIAVASSDMTFVAILAVVLGSLSLMLYLAADWFNTLLANLFHTGTPHVHSTQPTTAKLSSKEKIEKMGPLTRLFWLWSLILYYVAFTVLWLPTLTTEVGFYEICIVILGASIILVGGALGILAVVKFITITTAVGTLITVATLLFGSVDLFWTQVRFSNMNTKSIAATERRIEKLEQMKVHYGGLRPSHQRELDNLLGLEVRQKAAAAEAGARRESGNGFSLPELDETTLIPILLIGIVGLGAFLVVTKKGESHAS